MKGFKVLSYEEENKLSLNEKLNYYKELRAYLKNMPTTKVNDFYMFVCSALNKKFVRGIINLIKGYELTDYFIRSNKLFWVIHNFELLFTQIVGFCH